MAGEGGIKLPGVGHVSRRWVIVVAVASLGSIGYFAYRRKSAAAAAPAGAGTGQVDPLTSDAAGSAQDQMDLAALQDSGAYGAYGTAGGYYAGAGAAGASGVTPPVPGTGGFTTNGQWAQQAEADLGGIGIDPVALAAALGHYLTGSPLTPAEQSLADQAIAEEGWPPVAGPGGYPPAMHATPAGGGGGNGSGPGTATVPAGLVGGTAGTAHNKLVAAGLVPVADPGQKAGWIVTSTAPASGRTAPKGTRVLITAAPRKTGR